MLISAVPSVFGCIPLGSRYGNVPNELIHRAGPPFLDNHYRGYQYIFNIIMLAKNNSYEGVTVLMNNYDHS